MFGWFKGLIARGALRKRGDYLGKRTINRSALILRPKTAFTQWAAKVSGDSPQQVQLLLAQDRTTYLIACNDSAELEPAILEASYPELFERELAEWSVDRATWPASRTLALFREWFSWEVCSLTVDMEESAIRRVEG